VPETANEAQRRHWNDATRLAAWRRREPLTAAVTGTLLEQAAVPAGESVLDVGCGGGRTTIAAAQLAGLAGGALGADLSAPMIQLARERAAAAGVGNARFAVADIQQEALDGGPFDLAISQFGVMFFDDTVAAFASIRAQLRPGGRLAFVCWQALADNPWFTGPALQPFCPPPPPPAGKNPTGPFTLADPDYTTSVLTAAGWSRISRTPYHQLATVAREVLRDGDAYLSYLGVAADRVAEAHAASDQHLAPLLRKDGRYDAPLAFQVFTARA
jgi:SAM-dependent methyltransferase